MYKKSIKFPSLTNIAIYKSHKKSVAKAIVAEEKLHYQRLFETNTNNLGKSWKIIKGIINRTANHKIQNRFKKGDKIITDACEIAEGFNEFFTNIGPSLSKKIPFVHGNVNQYLDRVQNSIFLNPVLPSEIMKIIKNLKDSSAGWDDIRAIPLKITCSEILDPLTHICNLSIVNGVFPSEMKIAKVCPIFKNGDAMIFV